MGGDNDATGIEVVKTILDMLGKPESLIQYVTDRKGHDLRYALDSSKLKALGWKPQSDYEEAMQRTVDWYVQNEPWWRSIKSGEKIFALIMLVTTASDNTGGRMKMRIMMIVLLTAFAGLVTALPGWAQDPDELQSLVDNSAEEEEN